MIYLYESLTLVLFIGIALLFHFVFKSKESFVFEKIVPFVLIGVFLMKFFCYKDDQWNNTGAFLNMTGPNKKWLNIVANLIYWQTIGASIVVVLRPFFKFKTVKTLTKYFCMPTFALAFGFIKPLYSMMQESNKTLGIVLPIQVGLFLGATFYYLAKDVRTHISKHSIPEIFVSLFAIILFSMPAFMPAFFFGTNISSANVLDLKLIHRTFIYVLDILLPLAIYFTLRRGHPNKIRFWMIFISLATTGSFLVNYKYDVVVTPWNWPFHLCNAAMILFPICYVFKTKRVFYFTYFINVLGALFAMLMPDYASDIYITSPSIINFWINHMCAFWMPLLGVALKIFDRPKLKQYGYSLIGFAGYFILVMVLNTVFTGLDGTVVHTWFGDSTIGKSDYFFINSTFIADKMGDKVADLFNNIVLTIHSGSGREYRLHPVYQIIYFSVYCLFGFGMWFIYDLFFTISDSHKELHYKLKGIRVDYLALKSSLNGRSEDEPMVQNAGVSYKLVNFTKRYGTSSVYAVKDANLEVKGGEIFGFLGPNGAGKSTIIKSTVGIQPITEGSIQICGFDCEKQPVQAKSLIGFVPDHYALYEKLTGREYLNYIADIYEVSLEDRNERLERYIKLFELEASIDNKIKTYSHGMKQKITIMSALIHEPKVWILDEPLTGLDPNSIFQVKECMRRHAEKGNIVFFSSHLIDVVEKLCDRIAIIKHGQIQCVKTLEEIEASGTTLEDYYMNIIENTDVKAVKVKENKPEIEVQPQKVKKTNKKLVD